MSRYFCYRTLVLWVNEGSLIREVSSFQEAIASGAKYSASYKIDFDEWKESKRKNTLPVDYGPRFAWKADGAISSKGFDHANGLQEFNALDSRGRLWWKSFTDYWRNESIWLLYGTDGGIAGYCRCQHDADGEYDEESLYIIDGAVLTGPESRNAEKFREYLRQVRDERLRESE